MVLFILANFTLLIVICVLAFIGGLVMRFVGNSMHRHYTQKPHDLDQQPSCVRVTLQIVDTPIVSSREELREWLVHRFCTIALQNKDIELFLGSFSPSAQTMEALVPLARFDQIEAELHHQGVRVDLLIDRQVH